jgi:hypothetical protein
LRLSPSLALQENFISGMPSVPRPYPNLMGGLNFQTEEENSGNKRKSNRVVPRPYPNLMGGLNFQTEEENSGNKRKSNRVDRLVSEHLRSQRKWTSHTLFLYF